MMAVQDRLYTAKDLETMPDDGKIYELHNGVLVEVAGSTARQTWLGIWIAHLLLLFIGQHNLGGRVSGADGTVVISARNTRIPDVGYISAERTARQDGSKYIQGAPDLAIEVVSPSNSAQEMQQRAGEYLDAGSRLVWIVSAESRTVDVYRMDGTRSVFSGDMVLDGGDVLPGLAIPVREIFAQLKD